MIALLGGLGLVVYQILEPVAPMDTTILITGDEGTGRLLAARVMHAHSDRSSGPLIAVNCRDLAPAKAAELIASVSKQLDIAGQSDPAQFANATLQEIADALAAKGARVQRPLWASTSTKNPAYPDTLYVDELIGPHTVNTMPPATLVAFNEHGTVAETLTVGVAEALAQLEQLSDVGIDLDAVTQKLQDDGVDAFVKAFEVLLGTIDEKKASF